ncbi:histidine acid phosphatase family protein [Stylonychia lemnae]|uniref:Histidine acid phosphatase family protein n=1 Tax=Stylonychia lemnae TaxID=5949 RepID=A0A078AJE9_STYLE|nr:histidine acid phosphatase family protein [Stylonychia lemnae]|eukprot:CDW82465.1 histidine acid phosphatase family protein [Stylonychia lemnae]
MAASSSLKNLNHRPMTSIKSRAQNNNNNNNNSSNSKQKQPQQSQLKSLHTKSTAAASVILNQQSAEDGETTSKYLKSIIKNHSNQVNMQSEQKQVQNLKTSEKKKLSRPQSIIKNITQQIGKNFSTLNTDAIVNKQNKMNQNLTIPIKGSFGSILPQNYERPKDSLLIVDDDESSFTSKTNTMKQNSTKNNIATLALQRKKNSQSLSITSTKAKQLSNQLKNSHSEAQITKRFKQQSNDDINKEDIYNNTNSSMKSPTLEKFKDIIKTSTRNFIMNNKQVIRDTQINKEELETILVPKDEITELDEVKRDYYEKIEEERKRSSRYFKVRDYDQCKKHIDYVIDIASHAYDLETLRDSFHLKALVCIFFDDYEEALISFKKLRDVASEEENDHAKMQAYDNMGRCYNAMKNYENAVKCHKKQLELSWKNSDIQEELRAYEQLGIQHYYLGNLERSKYYNERCMRGIVEKKDSKIRLMYEDYGKTQIYQRQDRVTFKKLKEILESFSKIKNDLVRNLKKKIIATTYGTGNLQEALDFYRNGLHQRERPIKLREGSVISELSMTMLPSPRMVIEDNKMKNAQLLPYYCDQVDDRDDAQKKDKFQLVVARNLSKKGNLQTASKGLFKIAEQYGGQFISELQVMNRGKVKNNEVLEKFRQQRLKSMNIKGEVDMKDVLRKARLRSEKQNSHISINHLSPNRNLRHFRENEDLKNQETQNQFQVVENDLRTKVSLIENTPVKLDLLNEEQAIRLIEGNGNRHIKVKNSMLRKKTTIGSNNFTNNVRKLSMFRNMTNTNLHNIPGSGGHANNRFSLIEGSGSNATQITSNRQQDVYRNSSQKVDITLMSTLRQPQNMRLKRFNEQINNTLSNTLNLNMQRGGSRNMYQQQNTMLVSNDVIQIQKKNTMITSGDNTKSSLNMFQKVMNSMINL